jgi:DNA-binding response OmpR family regulator
MHRIALVEDHAALREVLIDVLRERGFLVDAFDSRQRALEFLHSTGCPDLMVLEALSGGEPSGAEFLRRLRAKEGFGNLPAVLLCDREQDAALYLGHEVEGYLRKPFAVDQLYATVARLLEPGGASTPGAP